jgi:ribosomal protein S27AE
VLSLGPEMFNTYLTIALNDDENTSKLREAFAKGALTKKTKKEKRLSETQYSAFRHMEKMVKIPEFRSLPFVQEILKSADVDKNIEVEKIFCSNCGRKFNKDENYCTKCGEMKTN